MRQSVLLQFMFFFFVMYGVPDSVRAQSGFSVFHGDLEATSYTCGEFFYNKYHLEIFVSEGVEQAYLFCDTIMDDGCEGVAYSQFGIEYGDTLVEGTYTTSRYFHTALYGYDSIFVHLLHVFPRTMTYDTLLLAESDLGSYSIGESVDSLYSSHGCDSVVFRMVYAVVCPEDVQEVSPYGVTEVPFVSSGISVTPLLSDENIISDAPPLLIVGVPETVTWILVAGGDTFSCVQNVQVDYPPCGDGFTAEDGDGNVYETVRIGADCWLKQNIKATHYAGTGDTIPVSDIFCADVFPDTASNLQHYGRLYSWYSAVGLPENSTDSLPSNADGEVQGVCPVGWHLPTASELATLQLYDGPSLKVEGDLWIGERPTDESRFSMAPGGMYNSALDRFEMLKAYAYCWLADEESSLVGCAMFLKYICSELEITCFDKNNGCSVRCAKD